MLGRPLALAAALTFAAATAQAAEIRVLQSGAFKSAMADIKPLFEQASGHKLLLDSDTSGRIAQRIDKGEETDFIVSTSAGVDDLIKQGKVLADSKAQVARAGVGVVVRKGTAKPDISTPEKFKEALLAAKSLGMSNPVGGGQSGKNLEAIFDRLGITEAMKAKSTYGPGGPAGLIGFYLLRKEVEIGIQQLPELMAVPGIDIIGPLPPDIQSMTVFSAGISTAAKEPEAAKALIKFLTTPTAKALFKSKGME